ncbi:MAG: hydroxyacid dehydrogenase [Candidatus Omnitrophica bacterium 4484_70.2]|nr:MAG: hydroxyacid dehydrogenase [Candidatus Omnitrophica bacterium 4484_70.2]
MKIGFFEVKNWEKKFLKKRLKNISLEFYPFALEESNWKIAKNFNVISVFIYSRINKEVISSLPSLKLVTTRSTGFDHIDLKEAKKRKILVCNVPFYGENTVAEHTFALILSLSRNVHKSYLRTLRGDFSIEGLKGFDLKDKVLGVIGAGHIGLHVIRIAKGFGMQVLASDAHQNKFLAEVLGFKYVSLDNLLRNSHIITLHVPYTKSTHHLINRENINLIKKGAILINTSRGAVVDSEALIEALDKKILSGVGLDVLEGEELIKEEKQLLYDKKKLEVLANLVKGHILLSRDNVVFTPHIGFYSQEALERILETTVGNIFRFLEGRPQNVVTG